MQVVCEIPISRTARQMTSIFYRLRRFILIRGGGVTLDCHFDRCSLNCRADSWSHSYINGWAKYKRSFNYRSNRLNQQLGRINVRSTVGPIVAWSNSWINRVGSCERRTNLLLIPKSSIFINIANSLVSKLIPVDRWCYIGTSIHCEFNCPTCHVCAFRLNVGTVNCITLSTLCTVMESVCTVHGVHNAVHGVTGVLGAWLARFMACTMNGHGMYDVWRVRCMACTMHGVLCLHGQHGRSCSSILNLES